MREEGLGFDGPASHLLLQGSFNFFHLRHRFLKGALEDIVNLWSSGLHFRRRRF